MFESKSFILGSGSPRRKELLKAAGINFSVDCSSHVNENHPKDLPSRDIPEYLSIKKSEGFHRPLEEDEVLITADTIVLLPAENYDAIDLGFISDVMKRADTVLEKPTDRNSAIAMLTSLSGRSHFVYTGVCVRDINHKVCFTDKTRVHFCELSFNEIEYYVDKFKPFDKAGAYGIQEWIGYIGIDAIEGSYYNVMGLPVSKLFRVLKNF